MRLAQALEADLTAMLYAELAELSADALVDACQARRDDVCGAALQLRHAEDEAIRMYADDAIEHARAQDHLNDALATGGRDEWSPARVRAAEPGLTRAGGKGVLY